MQKFKSVEELVNQLKPEKPVYCIRKNSILSASKYFKKKFPGQILYAVKTNPHSEVIKTLIQGGINQFDIASIDEVKAVRKLSQSANLIYKLSNSNHKFVINNKSIRHKIWLKNNIHCTLRTT